MSETIERARSLIEDRLKELDGETKRLEKALVDLGEGRPSTGGPKRGRPRRKASRGKGRAGPGQRRGEVLNAVKKTPGVTGSEIAAALKISPNQVYALLAQLRKGGEVRKSGKKYRPTGKTGK